MKLRNHVQLCGTLLQLLQQTWEFKAAGFTWWNPNLKLSNLKGKKERGSGEVILARNRNKKIGKSCQVKLKYPDPSSLLKPMW